jgi:hypothetical protein
MILSILEHTPVWVWVLFCVLACGAWLVGLFLSLMLAGQIMAVRGASWSPQTRHFRVPGSFVPTTLIFGRP